MLNKILNLFKKNDNSRITPKILKAGDYFRVEMSGYISPVVLVRCVDNDLLTRKVFIEIVSDKSKIYKIISYKSNNLKNFHLLNNTLTSEIKDDKLSTIEELEKELYEAIHSEDYEKAKVIQDKLNKKRS
jgi:hypothetical protein